MNNQLGGNTGDDCQDGDLPPVVLLAGNVRDHAQVVLLVGDNRWDDGPAILHGHGDDPGGQDLEVPRAGGDDPGVNLAGGTEGDLGKAREEHNPGDDPARENQKVEAGGEEDPGVDWGIVHQVDPWETGEADHKVSSDRDDDDDHGETWEKDQKVLGVRDDDPAAQPGEVVDPQDTERTDHEDLSGRGVVCQVVGGESDSRKAGGEQYPGNKPGDDPEEENHKALRIRGVDHAVLGVGDSETVQDPSNDPWEEDQRVICVRWGGQEAHHKAPNDIGDGQAVLRVGDGPAVLGVGGGGLTALGRGNGQPVHRVGGDEDEGPPQLCGVDGYDGHYTVGTQKCLFGGERDGVLVGESCVGVESFVMELEKSAKQVVHIHAMKVSAVEKGHEEEDMKFVMGKDAMMRGKKKHKGSKRWRGRKKERKKGGEEEKGSGQAERRAEKEEEEEKNVGHDEKLAGEESKKGRRKHLPQARGGLIVGRDRCSSCSQ